MKRKRIFGLFVLTIISAFMIGCSSQNNSEDSFDEPETHIHTYADYYESNESAHWRPATCGHNFKADYGSHNFEVEEEIEGTFQTEGQIVYRCIVCGYRKYEKTKKRDHTYAEEYSYDEKSHWHDCLDQGYEALKSGSSAHTYKAEVIQEPSFEEEKVTRYTCTVCGYSYESKGNTLSHAYSKEYSSDETGHWHACIDEGYDDLKGDFEAHKYNCETKDATYEETGLKTYTCTVCNYQYTEEIDKVEHHFSDKYENDSNKHWKVCTDEGFEQLKSEEEEHVFEETIVLPTFDEKGYTLHKCTKCDYSYRDNETDLVEHHYSDEYEHDGLKHWKPCIDEGYEDLRSEEELHNYTMDKTEPTFTEYGSTLYTCVDCGYSFTQQGRVYKPHAYGDDYESSSEGHWHRCTDEGYTDLVSETEDHTLGNWVVQTYPTNTEEGLMYRPCRYCGYHVVEQAIPTNAVYLESSFNYSVDTDENNVQTARITGIKYGYENSTMLIIPNTIGGYPVASVSSSNFRNRISNLQTVVLPNSLKYIGSYAFQECYQLENIIVPDGVTLISDYAFTYCEKLESVVLPDSLETISRYAFNRCIKLKNIIIPNNVTYIDYRAFKECLALESITLPAKLNYIGQYAFEDCKKLSSITIPDSVTTLESYCFNRCESLESITLPSGLTNIYYFGDDLKSLKTFNVSKNVTNINENNFSYPALESITVDKRNSYYTASNGAVYNKNQTTLYKVFTNVSGRFTMPNSVTNIISGAFNGCKDITELKINANISIDYNVLSYLTNLDKVIVDNSNRYYTDDGGRTIYGGSDKTNLYFVSRNIEGAYTVPDSVTWMASYALMNCSKMTKVTFSEKMENIPSYCCANCASLTEIIIPDNITRIYNEAFGKCSSLKSIVVPDSVTSVEGNTFSECTSLTSVSLSTKMTFISNSMFSNCTSLKHIDIPKGITSIYDYAFYGCESLTSVSLPATSLTYIGYNAFGNCISLSCIDIPASVESIANHAFSNCQSLNVMIGNNVSNISYWSFSCNGDINHKIFFKGTESEWNAWGNNSNVVGRLPSYTVYFYSATQQNSGNYWHYVNNVATPW